MESVTFNFVNAAFKAAAKRAALFQSNNEIEQLARTTAFVLNLQRHREGRVSNLISRKTLPIQAAEVEKLALQLRYDLDLGDMDPLFHLPELITEELGVCLFVLEQPHIASACALIEGANFVFVSATEKIDLLYVCARQLGHLMTLSARGGKGVYALLDPAGKNNQSLSGPYEQFADSFALELLIPARGLGIALQEVRKLLKVSNPAVGDVELLYLSRIFGVSFRAMARRCERAKLLPKGGAAALLQFLIRECGGPEIRANNLDLPPRLGVQISPLPRWVALEITELDRSGKMSLEQISRELGCSITYLIKALQLSIPVHKSAHV